jgi:hypothetical protein
LDHVLLPIEPFPGDAEMAGVGCRLAQDVQDDPSDRVDPK